MMFEEFQECHHDPILETGTEQFSNSESTCHPNTSHQVSTQADLRFGRRCGLKNFKKAAMAGPSRILEKNDFSNS